MSNRNGKLLRLKAARAPDGRARIVALFDDRELAADICDLYSDSDRERVARVIQAAAPALPLKSIQGELLKIERDKLPAVDDAADVWDDPVDLDRPDLPLFPVDVLPGVLGDWVRAAAHALQVPTELPGLLTLAACSGAVSRRIEIEPGPGWREPINLFVAVLLDPANRKSAAFRLAFAPIQTIERELIEREGPVIARLQSERRCQENQLKELERKAAKAGPDAIQAMAEARELAAALAAKPVPAPPRLYFDDSSPESVENLLQSQGGRLIVAGAEAGLFDILAGRYSGGVPNLDVFLKGHAGDDLRVNRLSRSVMVDRPCLTLAYAVQPQVIRGMAGNKAFRGRGLIGRFLYGLPKSNLGSREIDAEPVPDSLAEEYDRLIRRLVSVAEMEDARCWLMRLDHSAAKRFRSWQQDVETMLAHGGILAEIQDWGGKLCGLSARLASVIHLATVEHAEPWRVPVSCEAVESALAIARWSIPHAQAVIGLMVADDGRLDDAAYCLRFIRARAAIQVSRRDIQSHGRARFDHDPERLDRALEVLVDRGWLRLVESTDRPGSGRKSKPYYVHPKAIERVRGLV